MEPEGLMIDRLKNLVTFQVERFILRGSLYRLLFIALVIGLISIVAGLVASFFAAGFESTGEAIWWAFLRLTDPGYLGDDQGYLLRTVSTIVTVLGYVFFMGALIAIMTQGLNETIARLQRGLTPIAQKHHFLMLGWTNRTATIIEELLRSEERMKNFLLRLGAKKLRVVVLAEEDPALLIHELKERLGPLWSTRQITFRHGSGLRLEHLKRADFLNAGAILLPAGEFSEESAMTADARTIKTILATSRSCRQADTERLPLLVAEILDSKKVELAERAYRGGIEVLASNQLVSRLIAQTIRHAGLSHVFAELLTQDEGNELYLPLATGLAGTRFGDAADRFPHAVPIGVVRTAGELSETTLLPPDDFEIVEGDRLAVLAGDYAEARVIQGPPDGKGQPAAPPPAAVPPPATVPTRRVLVLGWNHKVPSLVEEFDRYTSGRFELDILSLIPTAERQAQLQRAGVSPQRVAVTHIDGDYTSTADLDRFSLDEYSNVVLLASGRLESEQESDARTILGYLLLQEALEGRATAPEILVELMEPGNADFFRERADEVLVSPVVLSHVLAQVALRRELRTVFDELFGPGGAEVVFRRAGEYGLAGREVRFPEVQHAVAARGQIALGLRIDADWKGPRGGVVLNPDRDRSFTLTAEDRVVVLTRT
jgi:hypothetical protein